MSASEQSKRVVAYLRALYAERYAGAENDNLAGIIARNRSMLTDYARIDGVAPELDAGTRIIETSAGGVPSEWLTFPGADPGTRLLWLHGGAWNSGHPRDYRHVVEQLARGAGASALSVDYRLAPENPFPAGLEDCLAAYRWLLDNGPDGTGPAKTVWLAGDSAGANLSLALVLKLKETGERLPDAVATLGASTDLTGASPSMQSRADADPMITKDGLAFVSKVYVQDGTPLEEPLVSPLYGDLSGLPPLLMHVGDHETLRDDSLRFAEKARAAGSDARAKVWPEMIHVFEAFCHMMPEARQSLEEIAAFFSERRGPG